MLNKLRILTPATHGILDYAAAALIVLAFVLNLGADSPLAVWLSAAGGAGVIVVVVLSQAQSRVTAQQVA